MDDFRMKAQAALERLVALLNIVRGFFHGPDQRCLIDYSRDLGSL